MKEFKPLVSDTEPTNVLAPYSLQYEALIVEPKVQKHKN